jgi:hypothetical protein
MPTSAVTDEPQTLSRNVATHYAYHLTTDVIPRHPGSFSPIRAIAPAGAIATTMNDMSRYPITQLQRRVTPDGKKNRFRIQPRENLKGQIEVSPTAWDGLISTSMELDFSRTMGTSTASRLR